MPEDHAVTQQDPKTGVIYSWAPVLQGRENTAAVRLEKALEDIIKAEEYGTRF